MSEVKAYRHTSGEWAKHPAYEFTPMICPKDDGSCYVFCHVYLVAGEKIIAEVKMDNNRDSGLPYCDNLIEMKANLALMSAAPKMLEKLVHGLETLVKVSNLDSINPETRRLLQTIADSFDETIAKATTY